MKKGIRILSLDPATSCGWALIEDGEIVDYGTMLFKRKSIRGVQEPEISRFLRFYDWLSSHNVDKIIFEHVVHMKFAKAVISFLNFRTQILMYCDEHMISFEEFAPTNIKKYVTGKGNAKKQAVMNAVIELGYRVKTDDEADAVALALLYLAS